MSRYIDADKISYRTIFGLKFAKKSDIDKMPYIEAREKEELPNDPQEPTAKLIVSKFATKTGRIASIFECSYCHNTGIYNSDFKFGHCPFCLCRIVGVEE